MATHSEDKSPIASSMHSTKQDHPAEEPQRPAPPAPVPFSAHFLDKDEPASKARNLYIKIIFIRSCIIILAMFAVFSIYWGALAHTPARALEGWIVDFDGGRIGQAVTRELSGLSSPGIRWKVRPAQQFPSGLSDLVNALVEEHCWAAVAINVGSTRRLDDAIAGPANSIYNSSSAVTAYGVEARNENAYRILIRQNIEAPIQKVAHDFAIQLVKDIISQPNNNLTTINPEIFVRPVYYTLSNLRPFDVPVASAATFVGLIYLMILAFFVVNSMVLARGISGIERRLTLGSLIKVRVFSAIVIYFVLSCFYSIVSLAFSLPFDRKFGHSGFVVFWMLSWFGMTAVGLGLESMVTLLTVKYIQVFLILWIITNVSVCLWPIEALPRVYGYGYGVPFYHISMGVRTIVFNTKNELGLNFGVLFVWIVVSSLTLPLFQWYVRREEVQAWRKQQEEKEKSGI